MDIKLGNIDYKVIKDFKNGFDMTALTEKYSDFFEAYDYILGDWAYGKLRLKGFYKKKNANLKDFNDYSKIDLYIKNNCAFECKYFILEKN